MPVSKWVISPGSPGVLWWVRGTAARPARHRRGAAAAVPTDHPHVHSDIRCEIGEAARETLRVLYAGGDSISVEGRNVLDVVDRIQAARASRD